jgi:hypothetical protein
MDVMRVSDDERDAAIHLLQDGRAEGRLSTSTFEERVGRALTAKSVSDLRELTVDIGRVSRVRAWLAHVRAEPAAAVSIEACLWLSGVGVRPLVVGRSRQADLVVCDETVSRRHAQIVRTSDGFVLTDLTSTNGTWLEGRRIQQVEVVPGDVVLLGDIPLRML